MATETFWLRKIAIVSRHATRFTECLNQCVLGGERMICGTPYVPVKKSPRQHTTRMMYFTPLGVTRTICWCSTGFPELRCQFFESNRAGQLLLIPSKWNCRGISVEVGA